MCELHYLISKWTFDGVMDVLQFLATALLGVGAFLIASRQYRTAHNALRLELFEKRYAIYETFLRFIGASINESQAHPFPYDLRVEFYNAKSQAFFLMPALVDYMEEVRQKTADLHLAKVKVENPDADHHNWVEKERVLMEWLSNEQSNSKDRFKTYLEFPEQRL